MGQEGQSFHFHIQITAKDLWAFSMYHSNKGYLGIFNVLFTVAALYLLMARWGEMTALYRLILIVCALMFTVWQPFLLYLKARKQAQGRQVREPVDMTFSKEGFRVEQAGEALEVVWEQVGRAEAARGFLIFYMDRIHAYLLPDGVMKDQKTAFVEFLKEVLPKERRKRI